MSFREKIEQQPTLWALSMLLAGFLAGLGAYESIIRIAQLQVVSKAELERLRQATSVDSAKLLAAWSGAWETDTETYKNLRIHFSDAKGELVGTYRVPGQTSELPAGRIEGRVAGNALIGRWLERIGGRDAGGEISFVLREDGRSFLGNYTREWEGGRAKHVWAGRKIE